MVYDFFFSFFYYLLFSIELVFFQFLIYYILNLVYLSKNIYYSLLYIIFLFFIFGIYLAYWQLEIFTGFLWLLELTVIFVLLLILFYLNFKGYMNNTVFLEFNILKFFIIIIIFFLNLIFIGHSEIILIDVNLYIFWENYYELLLNHNMNDFTSFLLSYYDFNSLELVIIGMILFIGSIVCVNLYKLNKDISVNQLLPFISLFNIFQDSISFNFLRKQNLYVQNLTLSSVKIISKKI